MSSKTSIPKSAAASSPGSAINALYDQLFFRADEKFAGGRHRPLDGCDEPWQTWAVRHFPAALSAPFAARQEELWTWIDALAPGQPARPFVALWGRGGGKSSTVEMGLARVCAKLSRRFALYVCGTQDSADNHVLTIAGRLEALGVERAVNKFGTVLGWRREQLRTANGFNVAGIGLDRAVRGIKLDDYRPDILVMDDIDDLHDSLAVTQKKIKTLTESILPTGSPDCVVLFIQNRVHANSIASQLEDGRADFLLDRLPVVTHPAVVGLTYATEETEDGPRYLITGGEATWEGQELDVCERQMNTWGLGAFLREAQHEVGVSGSLFFPEWRGALPGGLFGHHVCKPFDIPAHWPRFGGYDWGRRNPACFLLAAIDEAGNVVVVDEFYAPGLSNKEQAERVVKILDANGAGRNVIIAADPSMWAKKVQSDGIGRADVEDFHAAGLSFVQANNNRRHGWNNLHAYLEKPGGLRVFQGKCPVLIEKMALAVHRETGDVEDLDDDADAPPEHMDAVTALRYLLNQRPRASRPDPSAALEIDWTAAQRASLRLVGDPEPPRFTL